MKKFIFIPCFLLAVALQGQDLYDVRPSIISKAFFKGNIFNNQDLPRDQWNEVLPKLIDASADDDELKSYLRLNEPLTNVNRFIKSNYPPVQEFLSHLYSDDVDGDGDRDIVYTMKNKKTEWQLIRIFVNETTHYRQIKVPGHFIHSIFIAGPGIDDMKTVEFGCCDFNYDIYRKICLNECRAGAMTIDYCVAVPKGTEISGVRHREEVVITADSIPLRTSKMAQAYVEHPIYLRMGQEANLIAEDLASGQYLIAIRYTELLDGVSEVWGWVDRKDVEMKSGKLKAEIGK